MSRRAGGQAIVEAALVLPVVLLLGLGAAVLARVADATAGVEGATAAAAGAAGRAPSAAAAGQAAGAAFSAAIRGYGLRSPVVTLTTHGFARGGTVVASGQAGVDLSFAPFPGLPRTLTVRASATAPVETWRTR